VSKVLVVGGAGYIGSHTAKLLKQSGYDVIIFDNLSTGYKELAKYGTLIVGDIGNLDEIDDVFQSYDIDVVFHFAAFAYVGESVKNPQKYYKNNVQNTLNLLESMLKHNVKKIVFSSTCATYGIPHYLPLDEKHPQNPINPYGRTKLMIEQILKDYDSAYGLKHVILRYFNAAGADSDGELGEMHEPETHLIPLAIDVINQKKELLRVFGDDYDTDDGSCIRDYIHVEDLADAHVKAYEYLLTHQSSNLFNLGTEKGYSVFEIIKTIENMSGKKLSFEIASRREGDPAILVACSQKAKNILGWEAKHSSIENIIKTAMNWHKKFI
jgi:UDP-glucose 4-epimerase